jgi:hypothetical protein
MKKIIIFGFSHCGTTILKSIIGHIDEVYEVIDETIKFDNFDDVPSSKNYVLHKFPQYNKKFLTDKYYDDYIKIFIVRNPMFVYSSLNKRTNYKLTDYHSLNKFIDVLKDFIYYRDNPIKQLYTIRYEDIFPNNYKELKKILDDIGLKYNDNIFDNSKYINYSHNGIKLENKKPSNIQHMQYRTWQINQPFISNNDISKIDLTEIQKQKIINNCNILEVYPDIKSTFYTFSH